MTITTIRLRSLGAGAALAFICASGPVLAQDSDAAALEARVAQLEALIEKLTTAEEKVAPAAAPAAKSATTTYKFGGYAKFDSMFSDYSDGTPDGNSLMRQFYYAPQIPIGDGTGSSDNTVDFQARESRLNFRADTTTAGGSKITAFVEMDFFTHGDGNEVVSNSYSPRLRHAFIKYNKWTFGQTWSTFQDVSVLPEALDFVGPAESTTFIRQAMIRYTSGNMELAVENPQTFVVGGQRDLSTVPDLIARYTFKMDGGSYVRLAGLLRSIKIGPAGGSQVDETGIGVSASAKFVFDNGSDLRAMATFGDGVGRYVGLGFVPDGYIDAITGDIETAESLAWFVSYRAVWNDKWRSNFMYGTNSIDYNDDLQAATLNDTASSFHVNLIRSVAPKLDIGAEIIFGEREIVNGTDGDFTRIMFSAKYAF
ncbi:MAG: DcaP family trimeric outer membrane transporter [Woeseiaceae bacterium]|nr:DcaP family trimeric outer membrane transporter [Woeseiaceae bacterium]MDX2607778.1 DcaP family trimeric outer membrane transporter [Woeseiaceae bacterium]